MIPALFIVIEKMPLSPSGKIDKLALPKPNRDIDSRDAYIPPTSKLEKSLALIWESVLELKKISINSNFFNLGGNSIISVQLVNAINKQLNSTITVNNLFQHPTISSLARLINNNGVTTNPVEQAIADSQIDIKITAKNYPAASDFNILLTGANGFLGLQLLKELIIQTHANIYCVIRGDSNKLNTALQSYQLDNLINHPRIHIISGDLSQEKIGIDTEKWQWLAENIDAIYHNGAYVHHIHDYSTLKTSNVNSVLELIQLCNTHKLKKIHYISTLSSASDISKDGTILETAPLKKPIPGNGYTLSKWVSERILCNAANNGLPVAIYRPGNVSDLSTNGQSNFTNNHALLLMKSCIQMHAAPDWPGHFEMTPVNTLSQIIIALSLQDYPTMQIYNLANPQQISWQDYFSIIRNYGFPLKFTSAPNWCDNHLAKTDINNALAPFRDDYIKSEMIRSCGPDTKFASTNTQQQLQALGLQFPSDYTKLLTRYLDYLIAQGFLPKVTKETIP